MRISLSPVIKIAFLSVLICFFVTTRAQINTGIITSDAAGCEGITNYSSSAENHRIYYYPGNAASSVQVPATLTATSPTGAPMTFVWMKFVIDLINPRNGWQQVQVDPGVTSSILPNQGNGAYLVYVYDAAGNFMGYDLCWVLVTRLQPSQMPSANITTNTNDCDGPNTINGTTTGTANGLIIAPATSPFSYAVPPPLPLIVNSSTTFTVRFQGSQASTITPLVFALEGPTSCGNPIVYLGSVPGFIPASGTTSATGTFNPFGCTSATPFAFDITFSNIPGSIYNACNISNGSNSSTDSFYANPSGTANPNPTIYDFSPLFGCDASNGDWTFRVWECGTGGTSTLINEITANVTGGYTNSDLGSPVTETITGLAYSTPGVSIPNGSGNNCGMLTSGFSVTEPETIISAQPCIANGYAWHTDPEFTLPVNAAGSINTASQLQSLVLNNPLSDASGPLPYWQNFNVTLSITNVCHQAGIDNGCFGNTLQDVQSVTLNATMTPVLVEIPTLCSTSDASNLIANVSGVWSGVGVILSGTSYQFDPAVSGVGSHTITFNPDDPCYSSETMIVQVDGLGSDPPDFVIPPNTGYCMNASLIDLTSFVSEAGTFSGPGVDSNTATFDASVNSPGPIAISFTPDNGCPDLVEQTVTVYSLPTIIITQGNSVNFCQGTSITLDANGADSYIWSIASGNANIQTPDGTSTLITPYLTSNITIEGTENTNNCSNTAAVTLIQIPNETPSINSAQSFCNNALPLPLTAQLPDGTISNDGMWTGTGVLGSEFQPSAADLGLNTITYEIPDNAATGNCYSPATVNFTVNPVPTFTAATSGDATICASTNHPLNAAINEPGATTFQWSPTTGLNNPNSATPTANLNNSITYVVTAINSGCSSTETIVITVLPIETPIISGVDTFCTNGVAYSFESSLPGGAWSSNPANPALTAAGSFDPSASLPGDFIITYTPAGQCQTPADIDIVIENPPIANAGPDAIFCVNATPQASLQGSSTNSVSISWSPSTYLGDPSNPTTTINASAAGAAQYTLTATGPGGCTSSDIVSLTFQDIFIPTIDPLGPFCTSDAQVLMTANAIGGDWFIDGVAEPSGILDPALITSSSVVISFDPGTICSSISEMEVFFASPGDYVFSPNPDVCINDNAFNLADNIDFNGTFDNVDGIITDMLLGTINPAAAGEGVYNIICEVNDVCVLTLNADITIHAPQLQTSDEQICFNIDTTIQPPVAIPAGIYTYQWSPATFLNDATISSPIITFTDTLNYPDGISYVITAIDEYGCESTAQKNISLFPAPYVTTSSETIICPYDEVVLDAVGTPGSYSWIPAADILSDATTPNPTVSVIATTLFTVTLADINCPDITAEAYVNLPVEPLYNVYAGADTYFCEYTSTYVSANPGGSNAAFVWSTEDGLLGADSLSTQIHVTVEGNYTFHVTSPLGCIYSDDVFIDEVPLPIGTAPDTSFLCLGDTLFLNPGVWDSVIWDIGVTTNALAVTSPGIYPHEIYQDGCSSRDTFLVSQIALPYFNLGPDRKFCSGDTIYIAAQTSGEWNTGVIDSVLMVTSEGDYVMTVTVGSCSRFDSVYVNEIQLPKCNLPEEVIGCKGEGNLLDAYDPEIEEYYWSTGDTSSSIIVFDIDNYNVRISNFCGSAEYNTKSGFEICSHSIFIPNSFTPDGDNINDYWRVYANNIQSIDITVTNRFGETIFKSNNIEKVWLGDKNESRYYLEDGVYFYTIIFKDENGDTQRFFGSVSLLR